MTKLDSERICTRPKTLILVRRREERHFLLTKRGEEKIFEHPEVTLGVYTCRKRDEAFTAARGLLETEEMEEDEEIPEQKVLIKNYTNK